MVSESRVTWATSVPILVILGLSVLDLAPMYATDRQTDRQTDRETDRETDIRQHHRFMSPPIRGGA